MMYGLQVESVCRIQRPPRNIAEPVPLANIGWLSVMSFLYISQLFSYILCYLLIRQVVAILVISLQSMNIRKE